MNTTFMTLLQGLTPANFAMVMSTGIVSLALHLLGFPTAALVLFHINTALWLGLTCLFLLRAILYPADFFGDFANHNRGPGYLTIVAGTCILGNQFALLAGDMATAQSLLLLGFITWLFCLWGVFFALFTVENKPEIEHGINGAWLVATVSTQALVILGSLCLPLTTWNRELFGLLLLALFGLGLMLYIMVITLILYRFCYKKLSADQLSPTFWINAGAVAITTLAGSELILHARLSPLLTSVLPFIKGITLLAWGTATWWIIMLIMLGFWRHIGQKYPFSYEVGYWGMVFPMGMYTVCTYTMAKALRVPELLLVPESFLGVAVVAWLCTFYGMGMNLLHELRK